MSGPTMSQPLFRILIALESAQAQPRTDFPNCLANRFTNSLTPGGSEFIALQIGICCSHSKNSSSPWSQSCSMVSASSSSRDWSCDCIRFHFLDDAEELHKIGLLRIRQSFAKDCGDIWRGFGLLFQKHFRVRIDLFHGLRTPDNMLEDVIQPRGT